MRDDVLLSTEMGGRWLPAMDLESGACRFSKMERMKWKDRVLRFEWLSGVSWVLITGPEALNGGSWGWGSEFNGFLTDGLVGPGYFNGVLGWWLLRGTWEVFRVKRVHRE